LLFMLTKIKTFITGNWKRQTVIGITFACFIVNVLSLTLYFKNEEINESKNWVIHSYEVLRQVRQVLTDVEDMETGQRGYFLTSRREFLIPYENAKVSITKEMTALHDLVNDNPDQVARTNELDKMIRDHETLLSDQIDKFQEKQVAITVKDLETNLKLQFTIRDKIADIISAERILLAQRQIEEKRQRNDYVEIIVVGSLASILALLIANTFVIYYSSRGQKAEDELKKSEELYKTVTQGINEGVFEYDVVNHKVFYSPGFKRMLGYSEHEFMDSIQTFDEHLHPDDFHQCWENINKYFRGEVEDYRNIFRMQHKDGHYIWVMSRGVGIWDKDGNLSKLVGTHTDITDQKENEEYLKLLNADLENFTYITSHDLRSPLVNLKGFASELQFSTNNLTALIHDPSVKIGKEKKEQINTIILKDIPESLNYIKSSVERLDQLTTAILDLSRIGRRDLRIENINTAETVQKILDSLAYEINNKHIQIQLGELPEVKTDAVALQQIFSNIIDNAIKYLDDSRPGKITISGTVVPGEIRFIISDNGRGISENDKEKVFDMFKRARNVGQVRGVGMGMSFVKATIQRLGGKIWLESVLGSGTKFIFTIPNRVKGSSYAGKS